MVVVKDTQKKISENVNMDGISISAESCRRLMLEAVQLIQGLHAMEIIL